MNISANHFALHGRAAGNGTFAQVIDEVKRHYRSLSCLEFPHTIVERESQINAVGDFVKDYINDNNRQILARVYTNSSWPAIFWGAPSREDYHEIPGEIPANPTP